MRCSAQQQSARLGLRAEARRLQVIAGDLQLPLQPQRIVAQRSELARHRGVAQQRAQLQHCGHGGRLGIEKRLPQLQQLCCVVRDL